MSESCCTQIESSATKLSWRYRRVLLAALAINAAMFLVELLVGISASSVSLQADSLDFLGDAGNYAISLFVLGMPLRKRAAAALIKGWTMGLFGLWILASAGWHLAHNTLPHAWTMGVVGIGAFAANALVLLLLWKYRSGDSNMRSVWLCSRNDVVGNAAVLLAAAGVFGTGRGWPDAIVALIMALLALQGAAHVIRLAMRERRERFPTTASGTT